MHSEDHFSEEGLFRSQFSKPSFKFKRKWKVRVPSHALVSKYYADKTYANLWFILLQVTKGLKGPGKREHIVANTLLPMMFLGLRKLGNICCGHKMFLNKIRNIFVSRTQNLCPQQMLRARANGETFVSATMCPQQCVLVCQGLNRTKILPSALKFRA